MKRLLLTTLGVGVLGLSGLPLTAAATLMPLRSTGLEFTFGVTDKQPTKWDGTISVTPGNVLIVRVESKRGEVEGADGWRVASWEQTNRKVKKAVIVKPVVYAGIVAPPTATVHVVTAQGAFDFKLGDLGIGTPVTVLDGRVSVTRVPASYQLTDTPEDEDFPAACVGSSGDLWCVYLTYQSGPALDVAQIHSRRAYDSLAPKGNGDQLWLRRFDGESWGESMPVTEPGLDLFRPTVAQDGSGRVWVVWSQNVEGNWDLYARAFEARQGEWRKPVRLTTDPGADAYAVAARRPSDGAVFVVWQGWRQGSFDILTTTLDTASAQEQSLASSPADEWCPSIAFDAGSRGYVVYDTYRRGNYDVELVADAFGAPQTIPIAATAKYEARPSVAVDGTGRVWVAYEEAGANWGKDFGTVWPGVRGVRLYLEREVRVRCFDGKAVYPLPGSVPAAAVTAGYPRGSEPAHRRLSLPRICFDAEGRLWLTYRRHAATTGAGERWASFVTYHDGKQWRSEYRLPESTNLLDNRPALCPLKDGVVAVHSTDRRSGGTAGAGANDLFAAPLWAEGAVEGLPTDSEPAAATKVAPVHPNESEDVVRLRDYRAEVGGKRYQILRGEFHRHTELTSHQDMDGTLEEMWRYALDAAAMDWIGNGDHFNGSNNEYLWWLVQKQTDLFHHAPRFLPMFTYERSASYPSGHRNIVFAKRGIRPLPFMPGGNEKRFGTPEQGAPDIKSLYAYLKRFDGLCASHTSATGMGTDWRDNDPEVEPVVEIYQGCRQVYEYEGAPGSAPDAKSSIGGYRPAGFVWNALKKGYRLGFESSSDHYSTHLSYTAVYAEAPTREAILAGLKQRHCYAAQDNILLDVRCGEQMMGDTFTVNGSPKLRVHAIGTQPLGRVSIIRGVGHEEPTYVYDSHPNKVEVAFDWADAVPARGQTAYYYVRVEQVAPVDGPGALAWASPMWIEVQ